MFKDSKMLPSLAVLLAGTSLQAGTLGWITPQAPDVTLASVGGSYVYNSSTKVGSLTLTGVTTKLLLPGASTPFTFAQPGVRTKGTFDLAMTIDTTLAEPQVIGGSLRVTGYDNPASTTLTDLFRSDVPVGVDFSSSNTLRFLYTNNLGVLVPNQLIGVIISNFTVPSTFGLQSNWSISAASGDAFFVPLPGAAGASMLPLAMLLMRREQR